MSRLTFTPGNHTYRLEPPEGGKPHRIPSVTAILKLLAAPALTRWAANTAADYATDHWSDLDLLSPSARRTQIAGSPWQARDRAAASGTQIHAWAEQLAAGKPAQVPDELRPKVEAVAKFLERTQIEPLFTEAMVWSDEDGLGSTAYAGTVDLICDHPQHGRTILDWKTGKGVYPEHALQLAGYATAEAMVEHETDRDMIAADTLAVGHVTPDGVDLHILDPDQRIVAEDRWAVLRMLRSTSEPSFRMVM